MAKFAPKVGAAMLAALTLGTLLAGNLAYADTTSNHSGDHDGDDAGHNQTSYHHHDRDGHGDHFIIDHDRSFSTNWYRWHEVNGRLESYFDWVSYCQWFEATYGYPTPECVPYL